MKKQMKAAACIALALTLSNLSARNGSSDQSNLDMKILTNIQQDDWRKERDEFKADVNKKIEKNKKDIAELKAEAKNKNAEARRDYDKKIADLEARNDKMRSRMNDYKDDTKEGWQSFKREFNHDMDELGTAIKDVFKDNKK